MTLRLNMLATLDATGVVEGAKDAKQALAGLGAAGTDVLTAQEGHMRDLGGSFRETAAAALEVSGTIPELRLTLADLAAGSSALTNAIHEETQALTDQQEAWGAVQSAGEAAIRSIASKLASGDLTGAISALISQVSQLGLQLAAINPISNSLFGTSAPTLGGVSGLLGGIFSRTPLTSALSAATLNLFERGGSTGPGRDSKIAGLVHRNEYVFDARSTREIGVPALEALRAGALKGYRDGGLVTTSAFTGASAVQTRPVLTTRDTARETGDTFTINITTPDIQSFRAARTQIAGEFARLAARGQRGF